MGPPSPATRARRPTRRPARKHRAIACPARTLRHSRKNAILKVPLLLQEVSIVFSVASPVVRSVQPCLRAVARR